MKERWLSLLNKFFSGNEIYTSGNSILQEPYLNQEAVVVETIVPGRRGRVSLGGSFWFARCTHSISLGPGTLVKVRGRDNITLWVEPIYHLLPAASLEK